MKDKILEILAKVQETIVKEGLKCPKCGEMMLEKHLAKEPQQKGQTWFVMFCHNCDFWDSGFEY